jgi:hypothetical protein
LKIPNTKRAGGEAQDVGPEFKPWHLPHPPKQKERLQNLKSSSTKFLTSPELGFLQTPEVKAHPWSLYL